VTAEQRVELVARPLRNGVAGLAVAVALLLLFRVPLVTSFRAALVVLAAVELLAFGGAAVSRGTRLADWAVVAGKLLVLGGAYLALSQ